MAQPHDEKNWFQRNKPSGRTIGTTIFVVIAIIILIIVIPNPKKPVVTDTPAKDSTSVFGGAIDAINPFKKDEPVKKEETPAIVNSDQHTIDSLKQVIAALTNAKTNPCVIKDVTIGVSQEEFSDLKKQVAALKKQKRTSGSGPSRGHSSPW